MTQQPEALRLARELDDIHTTHVARNAAAELRRLHASCEDYAQHKQRQDQRVLELNAQRDALLEALLGVEKRCSHSGYVGKDGQFLKVIQAAIAKVTGETA